MGPPTARYPGAIGVVDNRSYRPLPVSRLLQIYRVTDNVPNQTTVNVKFSRGVQFNGIDSQRQHGNHRVTVFFARLISETRVRHPRQTEFGASQLFALHGAIVAAVTFNRVTFHFIVLQYTVQTDRVTMTTTGTRVFVSRGGAVFAFVRHATQTSFDADQVFTIIA